MVIMYYERGFTTPQIGLLSMLRPWISAPAGNLIVTIADRSHHHRAALIICYVLAMLGRLALAQSSGFAANMLYVAISEAAAGPMIVLVEAVVVAAATDVRGRGRGRAGVCVSFFWSIAQLTCCIR